MAFTENLDAFFALDGFAVAATLSGVAVRGVFDAAYQVASPGEPGMSTTAPAFTLATSAVPANPVGRALVVSATTYSVVEHQPDGTGVSVLILARA